MPRRKQAYLSDVLGLRNFQRCWGFDLNIIVNIWLSVKRKTQSDAGEIKSKEDIIERFRSACNETTQLEIEKLYASLPSHCKEINFNKGLLFKYQFLK